MFENFSDLEWLKAMLTKQSIEFETGRLGKIRYLTIRNDNNACVEFDFDLNGAAIPKGVEITCERSHYYMGY